MEYVFNTLVWLVMLIVCIPMAIVTIEALAALTYGKRRSSPKLSETMPDTVVLIPAHNEETVIARTLESLSSGQPRNCRFLCVAHNCADATADIARQHGVEVIEVHTEGTGGKPDALKAGLRWLDANPPEVVVIVDADCVVSPGTIELLATQVHELDRPAMAAFFFEPEDAGSRMSRLSSLAVLLKNYIRPLGLRRLGLPCLINGSGSAFPFHAIREAPQGEGSIAEDYQLTVDLLCKGYPTIFVPEARVDGYLPKRKEIALQQRRRWEHGHLLLMLRMAPRLFMEGLKRRDRNRIAVALELSVPPLAFLGLMWVCGMGLSLALHQTGGPVAPLISLTVAAALFSVVILSVWMRFAGMQNALAGLMAIPGYMVWKLPMYRDFFTHREKRWKKTRRD
jgi:cellulose synthase/poly-beta-1,6-N-acetylglucosamine synthase-like glycosyltransferase